MTIHHPCCPIMKLNIVHEVTKLDELDSRKQILGCVYYAVQLFQ